MAVPTVATYSAAVLIAAHTELLALIDAGAGAGKIDVRNAADALLFSLTLDDPAGSVNGTTGVLTLTAPAGTTVSTSGTIAYAEITDSDDNVLLSLPAQSGTATVAGKLVFQSLTATAGNPVTAISLTVG